MPTTPDLLLRRRTALLERCAAELARADEELADRSPELVDVANEQWDARVLSTLGETDRAAVAAIDGALRRLERGDYGKCAACGGEIAAGRLHALPEAAECAECATLAETSVPRWTYSAG